VVRLYLSSFRIGDHPDRLLALAGAGRRLALVANALDTTVSEVRHHGVKQDRSDLETLGFDVTEADLRDPEAVQILRAADVVWVRGGNVFVLRRALADSGADSVLVELITSDSVVYAGYSAGACVLAPSLDGLEVVDDVTAVAEPIRLGLAVLDRPVVPHVDSPGHPETRDCDSVSAEYTRRGLQHWALRDGEVLLIRDQSTEVLPRLPSTRR
jgi:dipeptidase E